MFMQSRSDHSVLRSLALSFGEGLAFSVGTKLIRNAARPSSAIEAADFAPVAARLEQIEQRIAKVERPRDPQPLDQKVIHAIVSALETRLQEQSAHVNRRLDEFAATVAHVVAEQVAQRAADMEERFQERIAAAVAPMQAELADLRERLAETENTMAEFVSAISMMCRKAAERDEERAAAEPSLPQPEPAIAASAVVPPLEAEPQSPIVEPPVPQPEPAIAASTAEPVLDLPIPAFAQDRKHPGVWRIPVASSFVFAFAMLGLLLRAL
jgi:tetrahydromethanopterin S-methyltransferase subunit G